VVLEEVERIRPAICTSLDEARHALQQIGQNTNDHFTTNPAIESATLAMQEERERFVRYMASLSIRRLKHIDSSGVGVSVAAGTH
jgi:hypothetical protein